MSERTEFHLRVLIVILCIDPIGDVAFWSHHWQLTICPAIIIGIQIPALLERDKFGTTKKGA